MADGRERGANRQLIWLSCGQVCAKIPHRKPNERTVYGTRSGSGSGNVSPDSKEKESRQTEAEDSGQRTTSGKLNGQLFINLTDTQCTWSYLDAIPDIRSDCEQFDCEFLHPAPAPAAAAVAVALQMQTQSNVSRGCSH